MAPRELTLGEVVETRLRTGDIITGIATENDFNKLELSVATQVYSMFDPKSANFVRKPLASKMRPDNFNGSLRNGTALIFSDDAEQLSHDKRLGMKEAPKSSLSLLVMADMHSTGKGKVGNVVREVTYYQKNYKKTFGDVNRVFGSAKWAKQVGPEKNFETVELAHRLAAIAIKQAAIDRSSGG